MDHHNLPVHATPQHECVPHNLICGMLLPYCNNFLFLVGMMDKPYIGFIFWGNALYCFLFSVGSYLFIYPSAGGHE